MTRSNLTQEDLDVEGDPEEDLEWLVDTDLPAAELADEILELLEEDKD